MITYNYTYLKKIYYYINCNCEILIDLKNRTGAIWHYDKKLDRLIHFDIPFKLAYEITKCDFIQLDSGNDEERRYSYRIDYDTLRENGYRGINSSKIFSEILLKYDISNRPLSKKDFK